MTASARSWGMRAVRVAGDWTRGNARMEDDDVALLLFDGQLELYDWTVAPQLPFDLAAIRHPVDVLGFVKRWGVLYGTEDEPEAIIEISEYMRAAVEMNWLLYRYGLIRPSTTDPAARRRLAEYWAGLYSGVLINDVRRWVQEPRAREVTHDLVQQLARTADFDEMAIDVREALEEDLWDHVEETAFSISSLDFYEPLRGEAEPPGDFILTARPSNLLGRAYVEVALDMTAGVSVAACPDDGKIFAVRDPRQVYCSDQCAGRARYRRWAQKQRQALKPNRP